MNFKVILARVPFRQKGSQMLSGGYCQQGAHLEAEGRTVWPPDLTPTFTFPPQSFVPPGLACGGNCGEAFAALREGYTFWQAPLDAIGPRMSP